MKRRVFQLGKPTQTILNLRDCTSLNFESENFLMNIQKLRGTGNMNVGLVEILVPLVFVVIVMISTL